MHTPLISRSFVYFASRFFTVGFILRENCTQRCKNQCRTKDKRRRFLFRHDETTNENWNAAKIWKYETRNWDGNSEFYDYRLSWKKNFREIYLRCVRDAKFYPSSIYVVLLISINYCHGTRVQATKLGYEHKSQYVGCVIASRTTLRGTFSHV